MSGSEQESYAQNRRRAAELNERTQRIRQLNDVFRQTFIGGFVTITIGVRELGASTLEQLLSAVRQFTEFTHENDPYDEHDFGSLSLEGHQVFWKIDYYDKQLEFGSPDPSDPAVTARVLTIMLASEY